MGGVWELFRLCDPIVTVSMQFTLSLLANGISHILGAILYSMSHR
jgi:hypothetical protein